MGEKRNIKRMFVLAWFGCNLVFQILVLSLRAKLEEKRNEPCSMKMGLYAHAKSIEVGRYFSPS